MVDVDYTDNILRIGENEVALRNKISDVTIFDDQIVVVIMAVEKDEDDDHNVVAVSFDGEFLWEIESPSAGMQGVLYNDIRINDGEIVAYNLNSHKFTIDPETGQILDEARYDK